MYVKQAIDSINAEPYIYIYNMYIDSINAEPYIPGICIYVYNNNIYI